MADNENEADQVLCAVEQFFGGDLILALLQLLPARQLALLRAVSSTLRKSVDQFTDAIISSRRLRCRAQKSARLREMDRIERAVLFEDFGPGWKERWLDGPTAQGVNGVRYDRFETRKMDRPLHSPLHPLPDDCLSIRGGGCLNFNGIYRALGAGAPVRPRAISFLVRKCARSKRRSFVNVFLSSAHVAHGSQSPVASFYLADPPEPADLFTVLISLQARPNIPQLQLRGDAGMVWLPSGAWLDLAATQGVSSASSALAAQQAQSQADGWLRIELSLDWEANAASARASPLAEVSTSGPAPSPQSQPFVSASVASGFRHVYVFVWAEEQSVHAHGDVPEVEIADLWLE